MKEKKGISEEKIASRMNKEFSKIELTDRQKKQMYSTIITGYQKNPQWDPKGKKISLSFIKNIKIRVIDLFDRKKKVDDTYEFFKPYYELVGLKLTKKDVASIKFNVTSLAKKLRQIADKREVDND